MLCYYLFSPKGTRAFGSGVEHILHTDGVTSSNLVTPTSSAASGLSLRPLFFSIGKVIVSVVSLYRHLMGFECSQLGKTYRRWGTRRPPACCPTRNARAPRLATISGSNPPPAAHLPLNGGFSSISKSAQATARRRSLAEGLTKLARFGARRKMQQRKSLVLTCKNTTCSAASSKTHSI